jgi:hypothetical protein
MEFARKLPLPTPKLYSLLISSVAYENTFINLFKGYFFFIYIDFQVFIQ